MAGTTDRPGCGNKAKPERGCRPEQLVTCLDITDTLVYYEAE